MLNSQVAEQCNEMRTNNAAQHARIVFQCLTAKVTSWSGGVGQVVCDESGS